VSNLKEAHLEAAVASGTFLNICMMLRILRNEPSPKKIVAFDASDTMLTGAKRVLGGKPSVRLMKCRADKLPFENNSFDSCNIPNAIHCFDHPKKCIHEIKRVIKPGGSLAVNVLLNPRGSRLVKRISNKIYKWGIKKGILSRSFSVSEARELFLDQKFKIKASSVTGNVCFILAEKTS